MLRYLYVCVCILCILCPARLFIAQWHDLHITLTVIAMQEDPLEQCFHSSQPHLVLDL